MSASENRQTNQTASADEEILDLALRARAGDDLAFSKLAQHYRRLIYWYLNRFGISGGDEDDYVQEALIGLLRAVRTFDESSASFKTYASSCIRNALVGALRKESRRLTSNPVSWDASAEDLPSGETPESALIDRESSSILYNKIFSVLSAFEKNVFYCYLANMSCAEIAALLDKEEKSVANALTRIRLKLSAVLNG